MTYRYADFDFKRPDYVGIFQDRAALLAKIRARPELINTLKLHYKHNPIDFIVDWGVTSDPRNLEVGLPALVPLILFPRQVEFMQWVLERWGSREDGLSDKSRDMGLSWCAVSLSCALALHHNDMVIGFGSRKEEYVDKSGSPKSLFYKARQFLRYLPVEFRGGFNARVHAPHMLITIPDTNSVMAGEAGDNIGRGDRASIYWCDESAFFARPQLIDAALSQTTNCRIDLSSVNGMDNPFAEKRHSWPERKLFTFHWRDDPRKDQAWYDKQCERFNPIIVAQEIDLDYSSSKEGVVIPSKWVQAAVDLHLKLKLQTGGGRIAGLDVADEGKDLNAFAGREGIVLDYVDVWSGKEPMTIYGTTLRAMNTCSAKTWPSFRYDSDGLGAGVRGDAKVINQARTAAGLSNIRAEPFHGSGEVVDPDKEFIKGDRDTKSRTNRDFFMNRKAQAWWHLRMRFEAAFKASVGEPYDPEMLISIDSKKLGATLAKVTSELSQPTYSINTIGKLIVDKAPDGMASPNYADAVMIAFAPAKSRTSFF